MDPLSRSFTRQWTSGRARALMGKRLAANSQTSPLTERLTQVLGYSPTMHASAADSYLQPQNLPSHSLFPRPPQEVTFLITFSQFKNLKYYQVQNSFHPRSDLIDPLVAVIPASSIAQTLYNALSGHLSSAANLSPPNHPLIRITHITNPSFPELGASLREEGRSRTSGVGGVGEADGHGEDLRGHARPVTLSGNACCCTYGRRERAADWFCWTFDKWRHQSNKGKQSQQQ